MKIFEVANPSVTKLLALANLLRGRAEDTGAKTEYPTRGFLNLASNLGVEITPDQLQQLAGEPPLNGVLEPMEPNSPNITFKTGQTEPTEMPVDKAQDIVAKAAKSAAKKDRSV